MNREYIYINGNVVVKNELNELRPIDYSDNLDEILVQENLIEAMEHRLKVLKCSYNQFQKNKFKDFIPWLLVILSLTFTVLIPGYLIGQSYVNEVILNNTIINLLKSFFLLGTSTLGISTLYSIFNYERFKKYKKGNENELHFLQERLVLEKKKLEKLQNNKIREKEKTNFRVVKVNDLETLKRMQRYLNLFYNLGIKEKKYYKYYQKNQIDKKLHKYYNNEELDMIEEFFEEKSHSLVKKR